MMPPSSGERSEGKPTWACTSASRCGTNMLTAASTRRNRTTSADRPKLIQTGGILITAFAGGAICTHLRVGEIGSFHRAAPFEGTSPESCREVDGGDDADGCVRCHSARPQPFQSVTSADEAIRGVHIPLPSARRPSCVTSACGPQANSGDVRFSAAVGF
jgi:hypothetical protein